MSSLTVSVKILTGSRTTLRLQEKARERDQAGNTSKAQVHGPGDKDVESSGIPTTLA